MTEYYFLGLEAQLRTDNRYADLDEATEKAASISKLREMPVRIYRKWPNNTFSHVRTITPNDAKEIVLDTKE